MSDRTGYEPIADYGLIGNRYSAALINSKGSIDWLCMPRFDSPSVFARMLDPEKGGFWSISPIGQFESSHRYIEDTNVLETTFITADGKAVMMDFGEIDTGLSAMHFSVPGRYIRILKGLTGTVRFRNECAPRLEYATKMPRFRVDRRNADFDIFRLTGPGSWKADNEDGMLTYDLDLKGGESIPFTLQIRGEPQPERGSPDEALRTTSHFWEVASQNCFYQGPYRNMVVRSVLTLALLFYSPTGALVAAPTTSLPEEMGGERNWDYRYSWLRDSSYSLYSLLSVGYGWGSHVIPAHRWMQNVISSSGKNIKILYPITPGGSTEEMELGHLRGYRDSRPVRIGNGAVDQVQLDVFGELALTQRLASESGKYNIVPGWYYTRSLADWIADNWREPDAGLWESRGGVKHFVYGKAMLWAALQAAVESAGKWELDGDIERWRREMDECGNEVLTKGWSEDLGAFKQSYEDDVLDASNLLLSFIGIVDGEDPRMIGTIDATLRHLVKDGMCYRYDTSKFDDGLKGSESSFVLCTFWLVEALTRAGRIEEAREIYEGILAKASSLGLFAEELDSKTGEHIGNFPQAFSQLGVIGGAVALAKYGGMGNIVEKVPHHLSAKRHNSRSH
ncbi:MAG: glycoside hydrolase family 15 protein [Methanomassiliicoccus sp.]|nr:glycoside hydrolase family 15 protein [Methanomassiliicoccus sp.]